MGCSRPPSSRRSSWDAATESIESRCDELPASSSADSPAAAILEMVARGAPERRSRSAHIGWLPRAQEPGTLCATHHATRAGCGSGTRLQLVLSAGCRSGMHALGPTRARMRRGGVLGNGAVRLPARQERSVGARSGPPIARSLSAVEAGRACGIVGNMNWPPPREAYQRRANPTDAAAPVSHVRVPLERRAAVACRHTLGSRRTVERIG